MGGGAAIRWISKMQKCATPSSSEAEHVAMVEGFNEALFLRSVWHFLLLKFGGMCIQVFEDSNGAIQLGANAVTNSNSKNIAVRLHFLGELF